MPAFPECWDKENKRKRIIICWEDGAVSEIFPKEIVLRGRDSKIYRVDLEGEHGQACQRAMAQRLAVVES